ncbi:transcriptional regulator MntR [Oxobacter pfennigii]|uniref:Manganese transport regulator n=2 Tax=Oxobacter pfennigii TaxID=36849 RepID=A0A0P8WMW7_9CLOT|nr:transcriptional regulator MntR [Oxobacter pfennigii]
MNPDSEFRTFRGYQLKNQREGKLTAALEDYLEMVYRLCLEDNYARVGKLSELLHVKPSSTSKMIFRLVDLGYLEYDRNDSILLTDKGKKMGAYLLDRHDTLERFLTMIGNTSPLEEAELVEHSLSTSTVLEIKGLMEFFMENPGIEKQYKAFKEQRQGAIGSNKHI